MLFLLTPHLLHQEKTLFRPFFSDLSYSGAVERPKPRSGRFSGFLNKSPALPQIRLFILRNGPGSFVGKAAITGAFLIAFLHFSVNAHSQNRIRIPGGIMEKIVRYYPPQFPGYSMMSGLNIEIGKDFAYGLPVIAWNSIYINPLEKTIELNGKILYTHQHYNFVSDGNGIDAIPPNWRNLPEIFEEKQCRFRFWSLCYEDHESHSPQTISQTKREFWTNVITISVVAFGQKVPPTPPPPKDNMDETKNPKGNFYPVLTQPETIGKTDSLGNFSVKYSYAKKFHLNIIGNYGYDIRLLESDTIRSILKFKTESYLGKNENGIEQIGMQKSKTDGQFIGLITLINTGNEILQDLSIISANPYLQSKVIQNKKWLSPGDMAIVLVRIPEEQLNKINNQQIELKVLNQVRGSSFSAILKKQTDAF